MLFTRTVTLAAAGILVSGAGSAQEFSGAATLGYGHTSLSDGLGDANSYTLDGIGEVDFQNGFTIGMNGSLKKVDPDGSGNDTEAVDLGLELASRLPSGFMLGGYLDFINVDEDIGGGFATNADILSYGIKTGYVTDVLAAEFHIGLSETSPSLPSGVDWTDYGINLRYQATDRTEVGGHLLRSEISGPGGTGNIDSIGLSGSHGFGSGWTTFGGVNWADADGAGGDVTTFGVGVGYDLSRVAAVPAQLSLELARSNIETGAGDVDADTVRLGLTMPLGGGKTGAPLNSVSHATMKPRHNALSTLIDTTY
ncbi:hypothetical protein K1T73_17040 [Roseovarius sp. SCSIO 43702]|uniref:hypothetical protein n=1 Tax=Roseovarius sp. SCSIO 43702 TaxID=2823043 RepID=UPI001C7365F1|nr:hypothetical protein [Roseovarius sp. SCSIO 43702]QYX56715.1 hypothetical protein K1T73_17040 [Roseovarius sp. SCSIO 43702]